MFLMDEYEERHKDNIGCCFQLPPWCALRMQMAYQSIPTRIQAKCSYITFLCYHYHCMQFLFCDGMKHETILETLIRSEHQMNLPFC